MNIMSRKKIKSILSILLILTMVIPMSAFNLSTSSGAYQEVSNASSWYTWGSIQSCADQSVLDEIYGNPVSAKFVNGEYVVTVDNTPNKAYRERMNTLYDWSLNAYGNMPDGTPIQGVYGKNFWADYDNATVYYGFFSPKNVMNRSAKNINDMVLWYDYTQTSGYLYNTAWRLFGDLVATDTTGNIASSICQTDILPGSASISFKVNTEGNCIGAGGQGKFSVGFVHNQSFVNTVAASNANWLINASCGLSTLPIGIYASFGSIDARSDKYDYCKVTVNGEKVTNEGIDGWCELPFALSAKGDIEYTLELRRTAGYDGTDDSELGYYSLYLVGGGEECCLAYNKIKMVNTLPLRAYVSYSTPAYDEKTSADTASYTITGIGGCKGKQKPENLKPLTEHNWDKGVKVGGSCVEDGYMLYTCKNPNCTCTKKGALSESDRTHTFGEWKTVRVAWCELRGYRERVCTLCGYTEKENIPALTHEYSDWEIETEPTCTTPGLAMKKCKNCRTAIPKNLPSTEHTFGDWYVLTEATNEKFGEKQRKCSVCGFTEEKSIPTTSFPSLDVFNYTLEIYDTEGLNYIRIANGVHTTAKSIKADPSLISLNAATIAKHTADGVVSYELSDMGTYSLWLRYDDGKEYIRTVECSNLHQTVSVKGVTVTVNNLGDVSDFFLALGHYTTYKDLKTNYITRVTSEKFGSAHSYKYGASMPVNGEYTCWVRYKDKSKPDKAIYYTCITEAPMFFVNGLQLTVTDTSNVKVIRMAPGTWSTSAKVKAAPGCKSFSAKTVGGAESYTIQNSRDAQGRYTISVDYKSGHNIIYYFDVIKKTPGIQMKGNKVVISGLDGLKVIRYAPGTWKTATDVKNAPGSKFIRYADTIGDSVELTLAGTYTFLVQYTDNSDTIVTMNVGEQAKSFTVSRAFTNDMVIQRDEPFSVWGWAPLSEVNKIVTVRFRGEVAYGVVNEKGEWKATFEKTFPESTTQETLLVTGNDDKTNIVYTGILTGDVYYVIGQSNVYWSLKMLREDMASQGLQYYCDFNDARNLRLYQSSNGYYVNNTGKDALGMDTVYDDIMAPNITWMKPSNPSVQDFSAFGYFLGFNLTNCVDTPIGIIEIDASGYAIGAFAPNELCDKWDIDVASPEGIHYYKLGPGISGVTPLQTRFAWNFQLNPLKNFSCAGVMWYQGESDCTNTEYHYGKDRYVFQTEFVELMNYYRDNFGNHDFPIYIMEFPAVYRNASNPSQAFIDTGMVRTEVGTIPTMLENSYVISSSDLWPADKASWWNNIHPYCKPEQAIRTCLMICAQKYHKLSLDDTLGPQLKSVEYVDANTVKLKFKYVGEGLTYNDITKTGYLYGLQVLTSDTDRLNSWMATAKGVITAPDEITITESIPIYGVRYNAVTAGYFPVNCNITNSAGMPMVAFKDINY